jgi:hypothetical protein
VGGGKRGRLLKLRPLFNLALSISVGSRFPIAEVVVIIKCHVCSTRNYLRAACTLNALSGFHSSRANGTLSHDENTVLVESHIVFWWPDPRPKWLFLR